jgi:GT2 family glycosyltransferase
VNVSNLTENEIIVSVIILNYNGMGYVEECIQSVLNQTYTHKEIIVIDNASTDGSREILREKVSNGIILVENKENLGFAAGNNVGLRMAHGRYIALLNNDAIADRNWLQELVSAVTRSDSSYGFWASKILFYDDRKIIDTAGHLIYPDGLNRGRGKGERDIGQYDNEEEVFFASGCAALYLKKMLNEIGFFDPDFFAYGDDTDIGLRARLAGWKCLYVPSAVVFHCSSATAGKYSPLKAYLVERNRLWILIKYFPLQYVLVSPVYTCLRFMLQAYGAITHKGSAGRFVEQYSKISLLGVLIKAYIDALKKLPLMLRNRIAIKKLSRTSKKDFSCWLKRFRISVVDIALRD